MLTKNTFSFLLSKFILSAMFIRSTSDIKYFVYISTAKIEMLLPQVDEQLKTKTASEWKLDLKFLSYTRRVEHEPSQTAEAKLAAIVAYLDSKECIGTVDEPKEYFRGRMPMRWGIYEDHGRPEEEPPLVYFGGFSGKTILGLGGSTRHVIGMKGASSTTSRSVTPYLVAHLLSEMGVSREGWSAFGPRNDTKYHALEAVAVATAMLREPTVELEFVAKSLLRGKNYYSGWDDSAETVLLGTPLYVAMTQPFDESPKGPLLNPNT
ncbi:MAG: DUF7019 family protein [Acidobacteriaceae bacterium]